MGNKKLCKTLIAIHHTKGSFSDRWIDYCKIQNYNYKLVDVYRSDIITQLEGSTHFLWHFHHDKISDMIFAKQLLFSVKNMGIKMFPNFNTVWHFDDKIGQKYLLESIGVPFVNTYIFYDKHSALKWANSSSYPAVFKLKGGASSANVRLIKSKPQAKRIINRAFHHGFDSIPRNYRMLENWNKYKKQKTFFYLRETLAGLKNYIFPSYQQKLNNEIEKGYLYIQDYIPNNNFDIRIVVIGKRAFGLKRYVRENDFRASGSGLVSREKSEIDVRCVKLAFEINKKINSQSIAFDFIFDQKNEPKVVEISYGFTSDFCLGYWNSDLKWHPDRSTPQIWMLEDLLYVD